MSEGSTVTVIGDGAVGLLAVLSAKQLGAERIVLMGRHQDRTDLGREFGATDVVAERGEEGIAKVRDLTDGGSPIVLEAVGHMPAYEQAVGVVRPGGVISRVGVPQYEEAPVGFGSLFGPNVTLTGGPAPVRAYIEELLPAVLDGTVSPGKVFDQHRRPGRHPEGLRGHGRTHGAQGAGPAVTTTSLNVLVVGATGSIGRHVVEQSLSAGHRTIALVRDRARAEQILPDGAELVVGDGTDPSTLTAAVEGIDAVVFTHGSHGGVGEAERIDYGVVRNVLAAVGSRSVRVSLMTSIGVTVHDSSHNRSTGAHDWKRRAERLVRRSGQAYTIVRPSWFDYNRDDQRRMVFLQGDTRRDGSPKDGAIARDQIARVLLAGLSSPEADRKTLELVAETGAEQEDVAGLFAALRSDPAGAYDGVLDPDTLPLDAEPAEVIAEIDARPAPDMTRHSSPAAILAIILISYFMILLDNSVIFTGLPSIRAGLDLTPTALSWVQDAYTLVFGGLLLLGARAGDLVGRRRLFVTGLAIFGAASLLIGLAPTGSWMIAGRALQGIGAAIVAPTSLSLITAYFEGEARSRAVAWYARHRGHRRQPRPARRRRLDRLDLLAGGVPGQRADRDRHDRRRPAPSSSRPRASRGRFDVVGALCATLGMGALVFGIIESGETGWGSARVILRARSSGWCSWWRWSSTRRGSSSRSCRCGCSAAGSGAAPTPPGCSTWGR